MKLTCCLLVLTIGVLGCQSPSSVQSTAAASVLDTIIAADNAGDIEAVMACYTPDALLMPPRGPVVDGADAIRTRYATGFENYRFEMRCVAQETRMFSDHVWVRGETIGRLLPRAGGEEVAVHDKFMALLRLGSDNRWRIARLMWSPAEYPDR